MSRKNTACAVDTEIPSLNAVILRPRRARRQVHLRTIFTEEPMSSTSQIEPFPLKSDTTGRDLAEAHLKYLKSTVDELAEQTVSQLIDALKSSSGPTLIDMSDDQWKQLANSALTIGSGAIDKITRRLTLQAAKYGWLQSYDYRPIATQIHAIATPARKIINGLNYRGKCVRAVLKLQNFDSANDAGKELQLRKVTNLEALRSWQTDCFAVFERDKTVSERFHSMYSKEWFEFCEEWNAAKIEMRYFGGVGFEAILAKYLVRLSEESSKSKIQWEPALSSMSQSSRPDGVLASGFTINFKRKPEQLTFLIEIPDLTNSEFNAISLDLMDLIEEKTGIKYVETGRSLKNQPDVLEIDILGEFTAAQSKLALNEIDTYLTKRFPQGK